MTVTSFAKPNVSAALHPLHTIWVRASAGSGKTKLLTDRLLRLLLEDVPPQRILCLTFSKAASHEIEERLLGRIRQWALEKDEAALQAELTNLLDRLPETHHFKKARCLYATLLDTTQPIAITTIHAFAQKLLQQFALEAGMNPYFQVIDETEQTMLWAQACDQVFEAAHYQLLPIPMTEALHWLSHFVGENRFHHLTQQLRLQKSKLQAIWEKAPDLETYKQQLLDVLAADPNLKPDQVIEQACTLSSLDQEKLQRATAILATGSSADQERSKAMTTWLEAPILQRCQLWDDYCSAFLVSKGGDGWSVRQRLATKALIEHHQDLLTILVNEAERLLQAKERINATLVAAASYAIACFGTGIIAAYNTHLQQKQAIDFDGLIAKAVNVLTQSDITPWVLYKLDGGLDHILVDEAQDTNPEQWQILSSLIEHFYVESPNIDKSRSVFVVGDGKQSIYGFQGADPHYYISFRDWLEAQAKFHQFKFVDLSLNYSFRSTSAILETVDQVFNRHDLTRYLLHEGALHHLCWRDGHSGKVILWPLVSGKGDIPPPWALPTRRWLSTSAARGLAEQIADEIQQLLADPTPLPSTGRAAQPEDVMILIRHRSEFDHAMIRALKSRGIEVQGQDKSRLLQHLVVQDFIVLASWALLPHDDFALATILKSPFCQHDEQDLFDLAYNRDEASLWQRLEIFIQENPAVWQASYQFLQQVMIWGSRLSPYEFFHHVLAYGLIADRIKQNFGSEGQAIIESLLEWTQFYQYNYGQGLQSFCHWLQQTNPVCQVQSQPQGISLRTIHSAKGLQAPIVFLPDTIHTPNTRKDFLWGDDYVLWAPQKRFWAKLCYEIEDAQKHSDLGDYYRLLYVALTRAQDRLYVAGWSSSGNPHPQSWYVLLQQALQTTEKISHKAENN